MNLYRDKYDSLVHDGDCLQFDNDRIFIFKMIENIAILLPQERFIVLNASKVCYDNKFYSAIVKTPDMS